MAEDLAVGPAFVFRIQLGTPLAHPHAVAVTAGGKDEVVTRYLEGKPGTAQLVGDDGFLEIVAAVGPAPVGSVYCDIANISPRCV